MSEGRIRYGNVVIDAFAPNEVTHIYDRDKSHLTLCGIRWHLADCTCGDYNPNWLHAWPWCDRCRVVRETAKALGHA